MKKALYISLIYLLFGFIWINFTDFLVYDFYETTNDIQLVSRYKGYLFVFITATFFFFAILAFYKDVLKRKNQTDILFSNPDIGMIQVSRDGTITDVHPNLAKRLGYTRKEILGRKTDHISHPDDYEEDQYQWQLFLQDFSAYYNREKRFLHKDGTPIWFKLVGTMVKDHKGNPYFIAVLNEIEKRKAAEKYLLTILKEKEVLINSTEDLMWSVDKEMRLKTFNTAYANTVQKWVADKKRPKSGDFVLDKYQDEKSKQIWLNGYLRAWNMEFNSIITKQLIDGEMFYFKTSFSPLIVDSKVKKVVCFSKDITEEQNRIVTLQKLINDKERSTEIFKTLFENIPVMVVLYHQDDNRLELNKELLNTMGLERDKEYTPDILNKIIPEESIRQELLTSLYKDFENWKDFNVTLPGGEKRTQKWINILLDDNISLSIGIDLEQLKEKTNNT